MKIKIPGIKFNILNYKLRLRNICLTCIHTVLFLWTIKWDVRPFFSEKKERCKILLRDRKRETWSVLLYTSSSFKMGQKKAFILGRKFIPIPLSDPFSGWAPASSYFSWKRISLRLYGSVPRCREQLSSCVYWLVHTCTYAILKMR